MCKFSFWSFLSVRHYHFVGSGGWQPVLFLDFIHCSSHLGAGMPPDARRHPSITASLETSKPGCERQLILICTFRLFIKDNGYIRPIYG